MKGGLYMAKLYGIYTPLYEEMLRQAKSISDIATKEAIHEIGQTFIKTYDSIIDQYYSYVTTSYSRTGVGVGTGTGWNLYYSNNITIADKSFRVKIDASEVDGSNYKISKDVVVDNVLDGIRGVRNPGSFLNGRYMTQYMNFRGNVTFRGNTISGTPEEIISEMLRLTQESQFAAVFKTHWHQIAKSRKTIFY